jgi:hypothetical protein
MKKATKKAYKSHLRLFCMFYSTTPDILVKLDAEQLKTLLDAYLLHLIKIAVKVAGKPKPGQISVNSIAHYFTGLYSFFVEEHEKDINWSRYERKFPERVANNLRSYYLEEIQKMYKNADIFDKPLVLLEYCAWVRVGAIPDMRFEHLISITDIDGGFYFLRVYADSAEDFYYVVVTPEFMTDLNELRELRERWGEKITPQSYLLCPKFGPHCKRDPKKPMRVSEDGLRGRMRKLMKKCGLDESRLQPNHSMRKAGNTAGKNADMDKEFKEMLMGHSCGLDDTYYDIENPQSRKEIVVEYMKAVDALTINNENRLKRQVVKLQAEKDEINTLKARVEKREEVLKNIYQALYERGIIKKQSIGVP